MATVLRAAIREILDTEPAENRMLQLARLYVDQGWHVFPLAENSKKPVRKSDLGVPENARGGLLVASIKADDIEAWWGEHPSWNIGIACGPSGLVVLDADLYKKGTPERWAQLSDELGMLDTFTVRTPRGGCHYYLRCNGRVFASRSDWRPAIDCKSAGGYVVAPGSIVSGKQYLPESDLELIDVPSAWAAALPQKKDNEAQRASTTGPDRPRHDRVRDLAWKLAAHTPELEVLEYVTGYARGIGLPDGRLREAREAVTSAYRKRDDAHSEVWNDAALGRVDLSLVAESDSGHERYYVRDLFPVASTVLLAARWKTAKTFIIYDAILDILQGKPVWGTFEVEAGDLRVLIWQFEMPQHENIRRLRKLALGKGIDPVRLGEWQRDGRLDLYAQSPLDLKVEKHVEVFHNRIELFDPQIVLIDSAGEAGFSINSNEDVRAELKATMNTLTRAGRCVPILTHQRKGQPGSKGDDGDSIIGAQSWAAKASRIYTLERIGDEKEPGDFVVKLASHRGWGLVQVPELFLHVRDVDVAPDGGEGFETATRIDPMNAAEVKESGVEKPIDQAKRLLLEALEKLQLPRRKNLIEALEDEGITKTTAARAYREMLGKQILKGPEGVIRRGR